MPAGRPRKYNREAIKKKMEQYIKNTDIPILAEFAYMNDLIRETLYEWPELSYTIKKLTHKKEAQLERKGLEGKIDRGMAIFSLKQLGWRDTKENTVEHIFNGKEFADALEGVDTTTD